MRETSIETAISKLTQQDLEDREDLSYLLSIMEKQGATGITQPMDYHDAIDYRDRIKEFCEKEAPEGSITDLFDDIIFDFDGVLYDSMYSVNKTIELMVKEKADINIPAPSTVEEVAVSFQSPFQNFYKRFGISFKTPEDIAAFVSTFQKIQAQVNSEHHVPATLFPEAKSVLEKIKDARKDHPNMKIHIISAGSEEHVREALIKYGILEDFDQIHSKCHDKSAMIKSIAEKSGVMDKAVMIGDLPSDIKDGHRVSGVKTIAITRTQRAREWLEMYLPDYVVEDLNGLFDLYSLAKILKKRTI